LPSITRALWTACPRSGPRWRPRTRSKDRFDYQRVHRVLAEGNFVLSVSEGAFGGVHSAFYDLFRVADEKLVEHWDTTEKIAPRSEWKNDNGKF
jgi:predicted SnoaL-like aldol condensation-catalyzing enzyme